MKVKIVVAVCMIMLLPHIISNPLAPKVVRFNETPIVFTVLPN